MRVKGTQIQKGAKASLPGLGTHQPLSQGLGHMCKADRVSVTHPPVSSALSQANPRDLGQRTWHLALCVDEVAHPSQELGAAGQMSGGRSDYCTIHKELLRVCVQLSLML